MRNFFKYLDLFFFQNSTIKNGVACLGKLENTGLKIFTICTISATSIFLIALGFIVRSEAKKAKRQISDTQIKRSSIQDRKHIQKSHHECETMYQKLPEDYLQQKRNISEEMASENGTDDEVFVNRSEVPTQAELILKELFIPPSVELKRKHDETVKKIRFSLTDDRHQKLRSRRSLDVLYNLRYQRNSWNPPLEVENHELSLNAINFTNFPQLRERRDAIDSSFV